MALTFEHERSAYYSHGLRKLEELSFLLAQAIPTEEKPRKLRVLYYLIIGEKV